MKKGFTLVELSIVLVIIGLLIGGILAAQSMITTAKLQKVIREVNQIAIAERNFQTAYNCIPGDCTNGSTFGAAGVNGNGNGFVDNASTYESLQFFYQLQVVNMLPATATLTNAGQWGPTYCNGTGTVIPGYNAIQSAYNKLAGYFPAYIDPANAQPYTSYASWYPVNTGKNFIVLGGNNGTCSIGNNAWWGNGANTAQPLSCIDAIAIDKKIDDGLPLDGKVITGGIASDGQACQNSGTTQDGYTYKTTGGNIPLFFEMDYSNQSTNF